MKRYLIFILIIAALFFVGAAQSRPATVPEQLEEQLKQMQLDIYLLGEKYYELEMQLKDMDERLKDLEKSHELAVFVNQDLDERLAVVEGRRR